MERLTITLSPEQRRYLRDAVASGQYASESEVLRDLIRRRQRAQARRSLNAALAEGLVGDDVELTQSDLADIWRDARAEAKRGRPGE